MNPLIFLMLLLFVINAEASDNELYIGRFNAKDLSGWKEQTIGLFKPKTTYSIIKDNDKNVLVARSIKSASGKIYNLSLDPKEYPILKWSWKIDHTIRKGDERTKNGDDFAVRVYVLFPRGFFSKMRAICYVWANKLPKGEHINSPFSSNIITVAEDSGDELSGHWTFHQRNIFEDYKNFFGEEPPKIGAVALMTDSDNTGESAVGYYGDISLIHVPKLSEGKQKNQKVRDTQTTEIKIKEQTSKGTKGIGEQPFTPNHEFPQSGNIENDQKHRELNKNEQPSGPTPP